MGNYRCEHIPDEILSQLDVDWGQMASIPEGQRMVLSGMAVERVTQDVTSDLQGVTSLFSGVPTLIRGYIERVMVIRVRIVSYPKKD